MFCKKVMVIGAGTMGSGIAQVFLTHGCDVILTLNKNLSTAVLRKSIKA